MDAIQAVGIGFVEHTEVSFPAGSVRQEATVVAVLSDNREPDSSRLLVVTDRTPFHPRDPLWPDQPDDRGSLRLPDGTSLPVRRSVTIARRSDGPLMIDDAVDAKRDEPGVVFLVAHVVSADLAAGVTPGTHVGLFVDAHRRRRLSAAHTACHLLAYSLNETTHGLWRKETARDSRGHNDFDAATCIETRHDVEGSRDAYRLGKSLRRRGFNTASFLDGLPAIMAEVNQRLADWVAADVAVTIEVDGPYLTDRRQWRCFLPGGTAEMPCGGTHIARLGEIASISADASFDDDAGVLRIISQVRVAAESDNHG